MVALKIVDSHSGEGENTHLFETVAMNLLTKGYSINPNALPQELSESLWVHLQNMPNANFDKAGVGRNKDFRLNNFVRNEEICWINGESDAGAAWLRWTSDLQTYLNRRLFLGLFSFESHFAHYAPGDFYKKHLDAFQGKSNRVLSLVVYLNPGWQPDDGGELAIDVKEGDDCTIKITPSFGTLVTFLSQEFPHEVLPAQRDRFSIAGWFRVNSSSEEKVDPPL